MSTPTPTPTELNAATAERDQLRAERDQLLRDYEYDHKCLYEVRERCESWKQRAERAEAELATERARLDWLLHELTQKGTTGLIRVWQARDYPGFDRAAIDAAMKEGAK